MSERLLIDMDGVLTDTMGAVYEIAAQEYGIDVIHADTDDYWFKGMAVTPGYFLDIMRRTHFYEDLVPITGAKLAINRLRKHHDVYICTAPLPGALTCEEEKRSWLERHFDREFAEQALVVANKDEVEGRVLIEDNPHVDDHPHAWEHLVLFNQRWNRHRTDVPRMNGWGDIDIIEGLMK